MNKSTRIARATFDIVFLLLLLLPIITFLLAHTTDDYFNVIDTTFDSWVTNNFLNGMEFNQVGEALKNVLLNFENCGDQSFCVPYFTYVVYVCIGWVFVNVLTFIPRIAVKLMKGWL